MASKEPMTHATSASGVTTEQDSGDSSSSLESLMKLKSDAEVLYVHAQDLVETTGRVWVQAVETVTTDYLRLATTKNGYKFRNGDTTTFAKDQNLQGTKS